jgi:hypothetical protein
MKAVSVFLISLGMAVGTVMGQADVIARERAKNASNQTNSRQGAQPAPAPVPAGTPARPAPVNRPTAQQQNIAKLKATLARVHQEAKATDQVKEEFARDLLAAAQGSGKPSKATLTRLTDHLLTALSAKEVSATVDERLIPKMVVLLNSGGLSAKRTSEIAAEARTVLQAAGVSNEAATRIANDLEAVAADVDQTRKL